MKKRYVALISVFYIELLFLKALSDNGIRIEGLLPNAIGVIVALSPIVILLILLIKDQKVSKKVKLILKMILGFMAFCYAATIVLYRTF